MAVSNLITRKSLIVWSGALLLAAGAWLIWRYRPPTTGRLLFGGIRTFDVLIALGLGWASLACAMLRRSRRALFGLLAGTLGLVFAWLVAEVVALLFISGAEPVALGRVPLVQADVSGQVSPDIAAAWGIPAAPLPFRYQTNRLGFRNPPDRMDGDVWLLGDSFLVAGLVPFEETLPAQLERKLARTVMNVALIAKGPQQVQQLLFSIDPPPDLRGKVVLQFLCEDNDLLDSASMAGKEPPSWGKNSLWNQMVRKLQILTQPVVAQARTRCGDLRGTSVHFLWLHQRGSDVERQVSPILDSLRATAERLRTLGASYAVVLIPTKLRALGPSCRFDADSEMLPLAEHETPLPAAMASFAAETGVPFLDLGPALAAATAAGQMPWFADDTHWNGVGCRVASEALAAWSELAMLLRR